MSENQAASTASSPFRDVENDRLNSVSKVYEHLGSPLEQSVRRAALRMIRANVRRKANNSGTGVLRRPHDRVAQCDRFWPCGRRSGWRDSSAMLDSPRRPSRTTRIFSSA